MVGIAAAICWDGDPSAREFVHRMLDCLRHRGERREVACAGPGVCLGIVRGGPEPPLPAGGGVENPGRPRCLADARIDNRQEFDASANQEDNQELLARGYEQWGTDLAARLQGDFALLVWDPQRRALHAARDPFGARPLYYVASPKRILLASEVDALLAAGTAAELDDRVVLDYLMGEHGHGSATFFRDVCRVRPGYWLQATADGLREQRYWQPPRHTLRLHQPRAYAAAFRQLFRAAVADRLSGPGPVVAHLSGGLDSASIVCMADDVLRTAGGQRSAVHVVSAVYPGLECDERLWIDAVTSRVGFPAHRWDASAPVPLEAPAACAAHPRAGLTPSEPNGDLRFALEVGATAVLSGFGGDELLFERGVFRDLAAGGHWVTLVAQTLLAPQLYTARSASFYFGDAVRALLPAWLRRAYRRLRPRQKPPPLWLGPRLRAVWGESPAEPAPALPGGATRECSWQWLTSPNLWWSVELQVCRAAQLGLEMRFPFLDRRLADFVLAVPAEQRLPRGLMKQLLRQAMRGTLPAKIIRRRSVTTFDCLADRDYQYNKAWIHTILAEERWESAGLIDRDALRNFADILDKTGTECSNCPSLAVLREIVQLELWLRSLRNRPPVQSEEGRADEQ